MNITIDQTGTASAIEPSAVDIIDTIEHVERTKQRVSQVEPVNGILRWAFYLIRTRVKEDSWAALFTRLWPCQWQARIFNGQTSRPFASRRAAINCEIREVDRAE